MRYLRIVFLLAAGIVAPHMAWGQGYPSKPVRIVVPFAAGSATDIVARLLAEELKVAFNQSLLNEDDHVRPLLRAV
jgi:tripartite-type tricarboxylate transporter receptor subunit TctC